jgi:hypothetical protein
MVGETLEEAEKSFKRLNGDPFSGPIRRVMLTSFVYDIYLFRENQLIKMSYLIDGGSFTLKRFTIKQNPCIIALLE